MKTTRFGLAALFLVGCGGEAPVGFDEFVSMADRDPVSGVYVYDGDQTAKDLVELREAYDAYAGQAEFQADEPMVDTEVSAEQPLIVNLVGGAQDKWPSPTTITYCISKKNFGSRYNQIVADMAAAFGAWAATGAGVTYTHVPAQDGNCTNRNNAVTFNVREDNSRQYYAKAFFPNYPRSYREVVISNISYGNLGSWTLRGILRHELGHTLGFRHEHIRPENLNRTSQCSTEDSSWAPLTEYDSASVMHYPHNGCAGTNTGDLDVTALDVQGALTLYPAP